MTIRNILNRFNYRQFWQLFVLALKYPLYVYPTLKATTQSFQISKKEFPKTHGKNGKANAFRHAFWNAYICYECAKWSKNQQRIITWTQLITDKHEELSPNVPLDTAMDLHNNKVGRTLFYKRNFKNIEEITISVKEQLEMAKMVNDIFAIEKCVATLVYIQEE